MSNISLFGQFFQPSTSVVPAFAFRSSAIRARTSELASGWIQQMSATACASLVPGVMKPSVFLGRVLSFNDVEIGLTVNR